MTHCRLAYLIVLSLLFSGCAASPVRPLEHSGLPDLAGLADVTTDEPCAPRRFTDSSAGVPGPESPKTAPRRLSLLKPLQTIESRIPGLVDERFGVFMRHLETTPLRHIDLAPHLHALKQLPKIVRAMHSSLLTRGPVAAHQSRFEQLFLVYSRAYFGAVSATPTMMEGTHGVEARLQAQTGFTDRNGIVHVFPGLSAAVWLSSDRQVRSRADAVDSKQITSDLVRIFLEAYFDASFMVPAAPNATALTAPFESGHTQEPAAYPRFSAAGLHETDVANMAQAALRSEAVATSAMGEAIRGGAIASLNNETLAAGIETAVGVIAKKLVERELFCYLSATKK
jgi:hypothetical protein